MCEKTAFRFGADELKPLDEDMAFYNKMYPLYIGCYRCHVAMWKISAFKESGARYECPSCGRLIKVDKYGQRAVLKVGRRLE